jgi:hypothetical protein
MVLKYCRFLFFKIIYIDKVHTYNYGIKIPLKKYESKELSLIL